MFSTLPTDVDASDNLIRDLYRCNWGLFQTPQRKENVILQRIHVMKVFLYYKYHLLPCETTALT